jgi:plasmid stability protein
MPTLTIRNLPDAVYRKLRIRAAHAGRSLEAEVREILTGAEALPAESPEPDNPLAELRAYIERSYKERGKRRPKSAVDELIRERRREAKRDLEKWPPRSTPRR